MVAKFLQPNYTGGSQSGSVYPGAIDASIAVLARFGDWFAPHEQDVGSPAPDLSIRLDSGYVCIGPSITEVAAQTVSGFTIPSAGQHRIDRVVVDFETGVASRIPGTAVTGSPSAVPPAIPARSMPICQILITSAHSAIVNSMITDERVLGAMPNHPGLAKGWAKCQTNGTVASSCNVASLVDEGPGDMTVNWATDFANINYPVLVTAVIDPLGTSPSVRFTSAYNTGYLSGATRIWCGDGSYGGADASYLNVVAFGDQ